MVLSDHSIQEALNDGRIIIEPELDRKNIRAAGIRVHLSDNILLPKPGQTVDLAAPADLVYDQHSLTDAPYTMKPGTFLLASTRERVKLDPSLLAFIDGRSTIARIGLTVHLSSTTMDGNYEEPRATTLEMFNAGNFDIVLHAGDPVGMLVFAQLTHPVSQAPQSQYRGQTDVAPPNMAFKPGEDE